MKKYALIACTLGLALAGCVEKNRDLTRTEREQLAQFVRNEPFRPRHEVSINFENKVELLGYDVAPNTITPGSNVTITWHWKVNAGLEDGWRLFTHVSDGRAPTRVNEDGSGLVRDLYQPGLWRNGEYIRDQQVIAIPADWNASTAIFYVGLWKGDERLRIIDGPSDGDNRARAATVDVRGRAPRNQPNQDTPELKAERLPAPLNLDGRLDEAAWNAAQSTRAFVNTMSGGAAAFRVTAKTLFDDDNFYVGFIVADDELHSEFENQDDHLWTADAVEIMVDPGGDGRNYFELQVSPRNVSFDTRYDSRRVPQPIGHADWDSELRSGVDLRGTVDDGDDDEGYSVEIAIPWSAFAHGTPPATRPADGESWRVNFYVMDKRENGSQRACGWSPPLEGDFHVPGRFGTVQFGDAAAPSAEVQEGAAAAATERVREAVRGTSAMIPQPPDPAEARRRNRPAPGEALPEGVPAGSMLSDRASPSR